MFCNRFAQIFDFAFGQLKYLGLFFGSGLVSHLQFGCFHIGHRGFSFWSFKKCQEIDVERIFKKRMIFVKESFRGFLDWVWNRSMDRFPGRCILDSLNLIICTLSSGWALKSFYALEQIGIRTLIRFKSKMTRPVATNRKIIMFYRKAPFQQLYFIVAGAIWVSREVPRRIFSPERALQPK